MSKTKSLSPKMSVFRRGVSKRDREVSYITNATREDGTNYLLARFTYKNEFGRLELPVIRAAITKDIKKAFDNALYDPSKVEVVRVELDNGPTISDRTIARTGWVSVNVTR